MKIDITEVKAGDRFVEVPELGAVKYVSDMTFGPKGNEYVKVWTTNEPVDRWGAPQQVEIYRPE